MSMATLIIKTISIYIFYIILYYKCRGGGGHARRRLKKETQMSFQQIHIHLFIAATAMATTDETSENRALRLSKWGELLNRR
jgi:uncharacterized membrane protein YqhA